MRRKEGESRIFKRLLQITGALLFMAAVWAAGIAESDAEAAEATASDFQIDGTTLVKYSGTQADTVTIPDTVKTIGRDAFSDHKEIKNLTIPGGVETIDGGAFQGCTGLAGVTTPNSLTSIGESAFSGCTGLESVTLGAQVAELGDGAFAGCQKLRQLIINKDNPHFLYESGGLYNADRTVLYTILPGYGKDMVKLPDSVTKIKEYAFWGCSNLKEVTLSNSLKEIAPYVFANCSGLISMTIPSSVKSIGLKAFENCENLEEITIPSSVTDIHSTAFDGCSRLNILADEGTAAAVYARKRADSKAADTEEDGPDSRTGGEPAEADGGRDEADASAGAGLAGDAELLGEGRVVSGKATVYIDNADVKSGAEDSGADEDGASDPYKESGFPKYTVAGGERLAEAAYYNNSGLEEYTIPPGIRRVGDFTFARTGLKSITLPEGVVSIGKGAFYHCASLEEVEIPSTVTEIGPEAWDKTPWLENWMKEDSEQQFLIVGDGILLASKINSGTLRIPEGVKQIGPGVFKDRPKITQVSFPDSLVTVGEGAFENCSGLKQVTGGNHVEQIKDRAFCGCPLMTIRIPASVKEIGLRAYDDAGTIGEDTVRSVSFAGDELPELSYEKSATRLYNETNRDLAFKGVNVAVVSAAVSHPEDTILGAGRGGFEGIVCRQVTGQEETGVLHMIYQTYEENTPDGGTASLPREVVIDGTAYLVDNTGTEFPKENEETVGEIQTDSPLFPEPENISAVFGNGADLGGYTLKIAENAGADREITTAFRTLYSGRSPAGLAAWDMTLWEGEIPLTRLGKHGVTVTLPIPEGLSQSYLYLVCTDEDGQLEKVDFQTVVEGERTAIRFTAGHFSFYGLYNYRPFTVSSQAPVRDGKAVFSALGR